MGFAKEALVAFFNTAKKHKAISAGGIIFAGLVIGGPINNKCNPPEEDFVKESEHKSESINSEDTGMIPMEDGINAILLPPV